MCTVHSFYSYFIHVLILFSIFFFFNDTATTEIYTLSYTTLFRSQGAQSQGDDGRSARRDGPEVLELRDLRARSEEHTSELQSQSNLVCRLLLEKKKKKQIIIT